MGLFIWIIPCAWTCCGWISWIFPSWFLDSWILTWSMFFFLLLGVNWDLTILQGWYSFFLLKRWQSRDFLGDYWTLDQSLLSMSFFFFLIFCFLFVKGLITSIRRQTGNGLRLMLFWEWAWGTSFSSQFLPFWWWVLRIRRILVTVSIMVGGWPRLSVGASLFF